MRFEARVAIVTGAARGIGRATALLMAGEAGRVAALDIDEAGLASLVEASAALSGEVAPISADAFEPDAVQRSVDSVFERWGRVDVLVNCIGGSTVIANTGRPLEDLGLDEWKRLLDFNLDSAFLFCRAVLPLMKRQRSGKIVNLSSRSATELGDTSTA